MEKCAFCPNVANLTGEHIWSDWINKILPNKQYAFLKELNPGQIRQFGAS